MYIYLEPETPGTQNKVRSFEIVMEEFFQKIVMEEDAWKIHGKKLSVGLLSQKKKKTYDTDVYVHVCSAPFLVYLDSTFSWHVAMWLLLGRPSSSFGCHGSLHNRMA
jgi:hypothetical protein